MKVWRLVQGQRWVHWPGKVSEWELQPAELAELQSELEMRQESKPGAELPSAPSELHRKEKHREAMY